VPLAAAVAALESGPALIVVAGGPAPAPAPAAGRARRLAARLTAGGVPAAPAGRCAWITVDDAGAPADILTAVRLAAPAPAVLAVAGPRGSDAEDLLAACGLVLVAGTEADPATALAADSLERDGIPAAVVGVPGGPEAAALRAGLRPGRSRRRALAEALGR
jgi:hypothetical protein